MTKPLLHIQNVHFDSGAQTFGVSQAEYNRMETGFKRLSRRSLMMAGSRDAVITDQLPDPEYLAFLQSLGACGGEILAPEHDDGVCLADGIADCAATLDFVRSWEGEIECYMASSAEQRLSELAGRRICPVSPDLASLLNNKVFVYHLLEDLGLPLLKTHIGPPSSVTARLDGQWSLPVIVRGSSGVGGSRVWIARDGAGRSNLRKVMDRLGDKGVFLLQPLVDTLLSPNLQFHIGAENICLIGQTLQILTDDIRHAGNLFDTVEDICVRDELVRQGSALAGEAASMGYRGLLGIDFIVSVDGAVYAVELNARHNTSTHALWFVNRYVNNDHLVPVSDGRAAFIRKPVGKTIDARQWLEILGEFLFDPDKGEGIIPCDSGGTWLEAIIMANDRERREWFMDKAGELTPAVR